MLFDESAIVAAHRPLVRNGSLGDAYRSGLFACCRLIENVVRSPDVDRDEAGVVADLGARMVNSSGAAALLTVSGYWSPAGHHVRDIIECAQLIEYFRLDPPKALEWRATMGSDRNKRFGFRAVEQELIKRSGQRQDIRDRFNFWANIGSHPSVEGLAQHMTSAGKLLGPTVDPVRFKALTADLWATMSRATWEFVATMDASLPHHPPIGKQFRVRLAAVEGARAFLGDVTEDDVRTRWN